MIKVLINNKTNFNFKYKRLFKKILKALVEVLSIEGGTEATVIIVNNKEMQEVSKEYRDKDAPTDILSFPAGYQDLKSLIGYNMMGDIYLSHEKVEEQAKKFGHSSKREWSYLFAHGLLHLSGYDHKTPKTETEMNNLAYKMMDKVKVKRNA